MGINGFGVVRTASRAKGLGGGKERFDRFVAENDERAESGGSPAVATRNR